MKAISALLLLLACNSPLKAQHLAPKPKEKAISEEIQKAIDEFNRIKRQGKNTEKEVTVVLEPPAPIAPPEAEAEPTSPSETEAVLITGKPPEELAEEIPILEETPELQPESATKNKESGLEIRVQPISKGTAKIDPSEVKLKANFAPKPLSTPPNGWSLEKSHEAPPLVKEVEIQPGTLITLRIQPHILSPNSDGINIFSVGEPGFENALGYRQTQTVSAILGDSVAKLDNDSLRLGTVISDLHNLLASLPKPEPLPKDLAE